MEGRPRKIYKFQPIFGSGDCENAAVSDVVSSKTSSVLTNSLECSSTRATPVLSKFTPPAEYNTVFHSNSPCTSTKQVAKVMPISLNAPPLTTPARTIQSQSQPSVAGSSQPVEVHDDVLSDISNDSRSLVQLKSDLIECYDMHMNEADIAKKTVLRSRIDSLKRRIAELQNAPATPVTPASRLSNDSSTSRFKHSSSASRDPDDTPIEIFDDDMTDSPRSERKSLKRRFEESESSSSRKSVNSTSNLNDLIDEVNADFYEIDDFSATTSSYSNTGKSSSNTATADIQVFDFSQKQSDHESDFSAAYRPLAPASQSNAATSAGRFNFDGATTFSNNIVDDGESTEFRGENFPFSKAVREQFTRRFGLRTFRRNQLEAINCALLGNDTFVLMPTGGGKSLCYQLPALITPGVTIVVSPLRSLIFDQVSKLESMRIGAAQFNSDTDASEYQATYAKLESLITIAAQNPRGGLGYEDVDDDLGSSWGSTTVNRRSSMNTMYDNADGPLKLLYVTPEKIQASDRLMRVLTSLYEHGLLDRLVIDEAHCVSAWGHDFRPDYKRLVVLRERFPKVPIMALTATATVRVRIDIVQQLGMHPIRQPGSSLSTRTMGRFTRFFIQSFNRANLKYRIVPKTAKSCVDDIIKLIKNDFAGKSGIVYCLTRKDCDNMAKSLRDARIQARSYHAGLNNDQRTAAQSSWLDEAGCKVICATVAFGMGIDKPDVRFVIHYAVPKSIEGFYQESGRAGRDNLPASCIVFYSIADVTRTRKIIDMDCGTQATRAIHYENLARMTQLCENRIDCMRKMLLEYFGEQFDPADCGRMRGCTCDNCDRRAQLTFERRDVTEDAKAILQTVTQLCSSKTRPTLKYICDVFRGAQLAKIMERGHDRLPIYGRAQSYPRNEGNRLIHQLLAQEILVEEIVTISGFSNAYLKSGKRAFNLLSGQMRVFLDVHIEKRTQRTKLPVDTPSTSTADVDRKKKEKEGVVRELHEKCYDRLVACAREVARARGVQNYAQLISNDVLRKLADQLPQSREEIMAIETFTAVKYARIDGDRFLDILKEHRALIELEEARDQFVADFDDLDGFDDDSQPAASSNANAPSTSNGDKPRIIRRKTKATAASTTKSSKVASNSADIPAPARFRPELAKKANAAVSDGDDFDSKYFGSSIVNNSEDEDDDDQESKSGWMSKTKGVKTTKKRQSQKIRTKSTSSASAGAKHYRWVNGKRVYSRYRSSSQKPSGSSAGGTGSRSRSAKGSDDFASSSTGAKRKTSKATSASSGPSTSGAHLLPVPVPKGLMSW